MRLLTFTFLAFVSATFWPETELQASLGVSHVVVGDFNWDRKLDLAFAGDSGLVVMLGNGDGSFQPPVAYPLSASGYFLTSLDLNGDGSLDLVANSGSDIVMLLGNRDGTFQPARTIASGGTTPFSCLTAADVNGDGKPDLVACMRSGNLMTVLLGNGDGTFNRKGDYYVNGPNALVAADLNHDGRLDLAITSRAFTVVYLGNGDDTFAPSEGFVVAGTPNRY